MPKPDTPVRLFIGSSAEGFEVATHLQDELETRTGCEVVLWRNVFEPSGYAIPTLLEKASEVDFAVLIATPDDMTVSRGREQASVRDNIVLEFGLFAGAIGLARTYLLATGEVKLPSDVFGLTRLAWRERSDDDIRASLNGAVLELGQQIRKHGPRDLVSSSVQRSPDAPAEEAMESEASGQTSGGPRPGSHSTHKKALEQELNLLHDNATAQGWVVKNNNHSTLRLESPKGRSFTMRKGTIAETRKDLRPFANQLRKAGLRVNSALLNPADESPFLN